MEIFLKIIMFFCFCSGTFMIFEPILYGAFIYLSLKDKNDFDKEKYQKVLIFLIPYIVIVSICFVSDILEKNTDIFWWATGVGFFLGVIVGYYRFYKEVSMLEKHIGKSINDKLAGYKVFNSESYNGFLKRDKINLIDSVIDALDLDEEVEYLDEVEKYMYQMLLKPTNYALNDFLRRLKIIRDGGIENLTNCELVSVAIDLDSFKAKLPKDLFYKAVDKYLSYTKSPDNKVLNMHTNYSACNQISIIQKEFKELIGYNLSIQGEVLEKIDDNSSENDNIKSSNKEDDKNSSDNLNYFDNFDSDDFSDLDNIDDLEDIDENQIENKNEEDMKKSKNDDTLLEDNKKKEDDK